MSIADLGRREPGSLRFMTCGSVDDGKSTLIGRLLFETGRLPDDQVERLRRDSAAQGMSGGELDYSLLLDGLAAEREQGITIDVAYRYFATDRRRFVVADTPGHEQYTRNMATGASGVELAVLLVDAGKGILAQTRRHASIAALMGVRHVVLAVNKIDLVPDAEGAFRRIEGEFAEFAASLDLLSLEAIPLSARHGDNVTTPSERFSFHRGPTLLAHLETVEVEPAPQSRPLRMPVQWIARGESNVRGLCGTIASGEVRPGDEIVVAGSGASARIAAILDKAGDRPVAVAGEAVTLRLDREIDASRGDVLAAASDRPEVSDQFAAHLVWMDEEPLLPGRAYLMKLGPAQVAASVTRIKHRIDVDTFKPLAAGTLALNDIGQVNLSLNEPVAFEPYRTNRALGAFILIDRLSDRTVAAGMIDFSLRRAANIHRQAVDVDKAARAAAKHQRPVLLWFTGLSGAGKSTVANLVEKRLFALGHHTYLLDGDNVRHGLNRDLGFTVADRVENIRRVAETAKLMVDAGLITLASFISPFRAERRMARELLGEEFVEIFVDAPLAVAETRDPKGLYRQARAGKIPNFTGIDSPYEEPEAAEIHLRTDQRTAPELADEVIAFLREKGFLTRPEIET